MEYDKLQDKCRGSLVVDLTLPEGRDNSQHEILEGNEN